MNKQDKQRAQTMAKALETNKKTTQNNGKQAKQTAKPMKNKANILQKTMAKSEGHQQRGKESNRQRVKAKQ